MFVERYLIYHCVVADIFHADGFKISLGNQGSAKLPGAVSVCAVRTNPSRIVNESSQAFLVSNSLSTDFHYMSIMQLETHFCFLTRQPGPGILRPAIGIRMVVCGFWHYSLQTPIDARYAITWTSRKFNGNRYGRSNNRLKERAIKAEAGSRPG